MVSRRIANSLALSPLGARRTVSGTITLSVARVRSLKVGGAEIRDLVVAIPDFSPDPPGRRVTRPGFPQTFSHFAGRPTKAANPTATVIAARVQHSGPMRSTKRAN
jgi:hypothetical protein